LSELGQTLREAREAKGLSLDDLQEITKIQKRYLSAIEEGDYAQLPGEFYTRAFIKNYAEAVDLDSAAIFEEFASEIPKARQETVDFHPLPPRAERIRPKAGKRSSTNWSSLLTKIAVVVLILVVLFIIWVSAAHFFAKKSDTSSQGSTESTNVAYKKSSDKPKQVKSDTSSSKKKAQTQKKTEKKQPVKQSLKLVQTQGNVSSYTLSKTKKFVVDISAKKGQQTWVSATDSATGKKLAYGLASAAQKKTFHFDASGVSTLSLNIGSVPNTILKINGKTFKFPSQTVTQKINITFKK